MARHHSLFCLAFVCVALPALADTDIDMVYGDDIAHRGEFAAELAARWSQTSRERIRRTQRVAAVGELAYGISDNSKPSRFSATGWVAFIGSDIPAWNTMSTPASLATLRHAASAMKRLILRGMEKSQLSSSAAQQLSLALGRGTTHVSDWWSVRVGVELDD